MEQKEVLVIIGVLVVGFFLLNNNGMLSGKATDADTEVYNYVTEPVPYGSGAGLGTGAGGTCPPPHQISLHCEEVGGRLAEERCKSCVANACDVLKGECLQWCNPFMTPGESGPLLCAPQTTCGTYGCFRVDADPYDPIKFVGGAYAMCICQDVRSPTKA